jgi:hypothetical protein
VGGGLEGVDLGREWLWDWLCRLALTLPSPASRRGERQNLPRAGEGDEGGKRDGRPKAPADVPQSEFRQNLYCAETANRLLELSKSPTSVLNVALVCSMLPLSTQRWA